MTPERLREIAQIINPAAFDDDDESYTGDRQELPLDQSEALAKARAIAPLIEAARAEGQKDMQERCTRVADGAINEFNGPERAGMARAIAHRIRALPIDGAKQIQSSDGGVEGHAAVPPEIPAQRSGESRDPLGDGSVKVGPHREDAAGIKPGPSEAKQGAEPKGCPTPGACSCPPAPDREGVARAIYKNRSKFEDEWVEKYFELYANDPPRLGSDRLEIYQCYSDADAILSLLGGTR